MAQEDGRSVRARKREEWMRELMAEYERGDETQREFCERYGMSVSSLQWWKRELKRRYQSLEPSSPALPTFVSVQVIEERASARLAVGFELTLTSGETLRIPESFDDASLERLLGV